MVVDSVHQVSEQVQSGWNGNDSRQARSRCQWALIASTEFQFSGKYGDYREARKEERTRSVAAHGAREELRVGLSVVLQSLAE